MKIVLAGFLAVLGLLGAMGSLPSARAGYIPAGEMVAGSAPFAQVTTTQVSPFDFTPNEIPTPNPTHVAQLSMPFGVPEINTIGKMVTTTFVLVDGLEVLPLMLVIMLAMGVIRWVYKWVTEIQPGRVTEIDVTGAAQAYIEKTVNIDGLAGYLDSSTPKRGKKPDPAAPKRTGGNEWF